MQPMQAKHRMRLAGGAAMSAVCLLGAMHHTLLSAQQDARDVVPASSSETIPFEPPVVHRGYGSHMETFRQEALRNQSRRSVSRDLLFRDEDRRTFKAVHPLLLTKPQVYPVHKDAEKE